LLFAWILLGPKGTYEAARNVGSFIANLRETANQAKDQFISALGEDYDGARREVEGIRDTLMGALSGETEDADEASDFVAENGEKQQKKSQREKNETVAGPRLDIPVSDRSEEDARAYFLDALQRVQDPNQVPPYMAAVGMSAERNHTTNGSIVSESDSIENDEFEASYIGFRRLQGLEERVATLEAAIAELKSLIETQHEQRVS
jgi:Sec-independent protein translocase protein TatA